MKYISLLAAIFWLMQSPCLAMEEDERAGHQMTQAPDRSRG